LGGGKGARVYDYEHDLYTRWTVLSHLILVGLMDGTSPGFLLLLFFFVFFFFFFFAEIEQQQFP
jgi:hypothetical protein